MSDWFCSGFLQIACSVYYVQAPVVLQNAVIVWKLEEQFESHLLTCAIHHVEIALYVGGNNVSTGVCTIVFDFLT